MIMTLLDVFVDVLLDKYFTLKSCIRKLTIYGHFKHNKTHYLWQHHA